MPRPRVFNKHHKNSPKDAVYIGRGSPYGNPFVIGKDGNRNEVCNSFEKEILPTLDLEPLFGKDLVCFCKPKRCHGDSILRAVQLQQMRRTHVLEETNNSDSTGYRDSIFEIPTD